MPIVVLTGIHSLVFGHSRYYIPLIPLLAIYAAAVWEAGPRDVWRRAGRARYAAAVTLIVLVGAWIRQIAIVDAARVQALFKLLF